MTEEGEWNEEHTDRNRKKGRNLAYLAKIIIIHIKENYYA
jgi:hypothetical protein